MEAAAAAARLKKEPDREVVLAETDFSRFYMHQHQSLMSSVSQSRAGKAKCQGSCSRHMFTPLTKKWASYVSTCYSSY